MTLLTVWNDDDEETPVVRTEEFDEISVELKEIGVRLERWELRELSAEPTEEEILEAYRAEIDEVSEREGYGFVDVVSMHPVDDEGWREQARQAREKFLNEHTHDDDEDRFFASGSGVFYLHVDGKVYAVLCEAGDLLSVPAHTTHWFDMGTAPEYDAVRFFHDDDGWVGNFTGDPIASRFPTYDQIVASR